MAQSLVPSVQRYQQLIHALLRFCSSLRPNGSIEPAITSADLQPIFTEHEGLLRSNDANFAAIETACRSRFYHILATETIDTPRFGQMWSLLDVVTIMSDLGHCEPGLGFWLVEELLDSQTIDGCKIVFDYLDSRRERLIAKHFKQKSLIILRACNELLRRLSRAENTVFCGRVFIFLFQSFPLGDRSSVNLRGEFHTENLTSFEDGLDQGTDGTIGDGMEVESEHQGKSEEALEKERMDRLYARFWRLQDFFSQPMRLFDKSNLEMFKATADETLTKFQAVHDEQKGRSLAETARTNRRTNVDDETQADAAIFNPKYLTSRDLFDLEIRDLAFRRHILVQLLIIIDFLLSLTPKGKTNIENAANKSIAYSYILGAADAQWSIDMRAKIATYLQEGPEGKFYYRMVDTVMARDKNWVQWKADNCPPISRQPVTAQEWVDSRSNAQKCFSKKRLRPVPMGTLDLKFLSEDNGSAGFDHLRQPERYMIPTIESFKKGIESDDLDMEMAQTEEEKRLAKDAKASKMWRTLRIASRGRFQCLNKLDDGKNLAALFDDRPEVGPEPELKSEPHLGTDPKLELESDTQPKVRASTESETNAHTPSTLNIPPISASPSASKRGAPIDVHKTPNSAERSTRFRKHESKNGIAVGADTTIPTQDVEMNGT